ncbi:MAG: hypothetical protein NTW84_04395, partial [Methanothrix sp.]|nr:hypothetical protein [Methanothrix sp.]
AVNNLAKALQRSQKLKDKPINEIAKDLENLSKNYETALKHLSSVEDNAPNAVKIIQIGLPIIEEIIRAAIAGIKEKANHIDQMTSGTGTVIEQFVSEINRAAASLSHEDSQKMQECSMRIVDQMRHVCEQLSFEYCGLACQVLREADQENDPLEKLFKIELALSYLSQNILRVVHDEQLKRVENTLAMIQQDQIDLINEVKSNVEKHLYSESLLNETLNVLKKLLEEMDRRKEIKPNYRMKGAANYINDSHISVKQKLVATIPLIPFILNYKLEIESAKELQAVWEKLTDKSTHRG